MSRNSNFFGRSTWLRVMRSLLYLKYKTNSHAYLPQVEVLPQGDEFVTAKFAGLIHLTESQESHECKIFRSGTDFYFLLPTSTNIYLLLRFLLLPFQYLCMPSLL